MNQKLAQFSHSSHFYPNTSVWHCGIKPAPCRTSQNQLIVVKLADVIIDAYVMNSETVANCSPMVGIVKEYGIDLLYMILITDSRHTVTSWKHRKTEICTNTVCFITQTYKRGENEMYLPVIKLFFRFHDTWSGYITFPRSSETKRNRGQGAVFVF